MTKRGAIIFAAIVVVGLALLVGGFFLLFEKVEKEVYQPPVGEARTNPYLALERFLNADGWEADTVLTLSEPDYGSDLVVMTGPTQDYGPDQIAQWELWVTDGNHLVIPETPAELRRSDDMVEAFGFGPPPEIEEIDLEELVEEAAADVEEGSKKAEGSKTKEGSKGAAKKGGIETEELEEALDAAEEATEGDDPIPMWGEPIEIPEGIETIRFTTDCPSTRLDVTVKGIDRVWIGDDGCLLAASRPFAKGRVTIVPKMNTFSNTRIENFDNAAMAHDIFWQTTEAPDAQRATIALYGERVSWIGYLWGLFWPTGVTLLIILGFALLAGSRRFGPMVAPIPNRRRQRTEHVMAIGRFLWKHDSADILLRAAQEALLVRVGRGTIPSNLDRDERAKWLAERTDIPVDQARRILAEHAPPNVDRFAELIEQIEELRRR